MWKGNTHWKLHQALQSIILRVERLVDHCTNARLGATL
jgi:hypothetical protein